MRVNPPNASHAQHSQKKDDEIVRLAFEIETLKDNLAKYEQVAQTMQDLSRSRGSAAGSTLHRLDLSNRSQRW